MTGNNGQSRPHQEVAMGPGDAAHTLLMEKIRAAMNELITARRARSLARLVLRASRTHLIPAGDDLPSWIGDAVGPKGLEMAVEGFARLDSGCCAHGFETCEACDGTGAFDGTCETCAGIGQVRCSFCGGSSLIPYDDVPDALRGSVIRSRLSLETNAFDQLREATKADTALDEHAVERWQRRLQNLEKLMGVLDNAHQAFLRLAPPLRSASLHARMTKAELEVRAFQFDVVLPSLQAAWSRRSEESRGEATEVADDRDRADFYERLIARRNLRGTGIARPFLFADDKDEATIASSPSDRDGGPQSLNLDVARTIEPHHRVNPPPAA